MKQDFLTPSGRIVQGDPFEAQTKNMQGQPLVTQSGQPTQRYFIAVAFRKDDPLFPAFYQKAQDCARASFPALFNAQGQCTHPRFSWKIVDGDGVDDNGKPNANKEGFAGHWVVKFSSSFAPRCYHAGHYAPHEQIQDPKAIQRGYYVRVAGTMEGNDQPNKPGLYMNLGMVELVMARPDLIIQSGPDAASVFGGSAPALPAGIPAAPSLPGMMPSMMPTPPTPVLSLPANGVLPGAAPFAGAVAPPSLPMPSVAAAPVGPATTSPSSIPVVPNAAILAGPPAAPQMTAKAGGATYQQFVAQGWTDEMLRAQGFMV